MNVLKYSKLMSIKLSLTLNYEIEYEDIVIKLNKAGLINVKKNLFSVADAIFVNDKHFKDIFIMERLLSNEGLAYTNRNEDLIWSRHYKNRFTEIPLRFL